MNTISKLLIASAIVASFAAPAFASDSSELQANVTTSQTQTQDWTKAYAMDGSAPAIHSAASTRGFDPINGGM